MNRTDRLHAVSEELRRAGSRGRTSAQLARKLEVSERTIKRDVSALQQAGLPVWAQAGPGGGYVLDAAATLPPVNLTAGQAVSVAVALAANPGAPFAVDGKAALDKLLDVMDPPTRARAQRLAARMWVRPLAGTATTLPARAAVEEAVRLGRALVIDYVDSGGAASRRTVEPQWLAMRGGHWYLVAWCRERVGPRWFRWDRIAAGHVTREEVEERDPALFGEPPPDARQVGLG